MLDTQQKLQSNISKVLFINFSYMFLVLIPVIVPFFQQYGLSMEQIYILQSIFAISTVVLEVPSGYVADLLGRKNSLIAAGIFSGCGMLILNFSESFYGFILFELLTAISVSLFSGSDVALIYDTLAQLKHKSFSESAVLGRKIFSSQIGETAASLLGGALALYSLNLPAKIHAITAWIPFLIALTLYEPPRKKMDKLRHLENLRYIYNSLFRKSRLLTLIVLNLMVYGVSTLLAVWAFQGYWKMIDVPLYYFGYLWAAYNLIVAITGKYAHTAERKLGSVGVIIIIAILPIIGYFGMGYFVFWAGILFGLAFQVSRGLGQVILRDALNARVTADFRATANSIASLGVRLSFAFLGPLMGFLIDSEGYSITFYCFGGFYIAAFFVFCLPLLAQRKHFRELVDND